MKRTIWAVMAVVVLVIVAITVWVVRQTRPAPSAARLLPASTLLFLDVPDFARARTGFAKTQAHALLQEPEVQALLEEPRRALAEMLGAKPGAAEKDGQYILDAIEGELFVAVTKFAVMPLPKPSLVFGADLKSNLLKTRAALAYQERKLRQYNPQAQFSAAEHLGVTYSLWRLGAGRELAHAFLGSLLVFASDEETMRELIGRWKGRAPAETPALADNPSYQSIVAGLPKTPEFVAFLNVERITQLVGPLLMLAGQGGSVLQKVARIQATGLGTVYDGGAFRDTGFTLYKTDATEPLPPTGRRTLPFTTAETMLYAAQSINWGSAYQELLDSLVSQPRAAKAAMQFERILRNQEIRAREDFFNHLGPETALLVTWREGTKFPDLAVAIELANEQAQQRVGVVLDSLQKTLLGTDSGLEWEKSTVQGREFATLRLGAGLVAPTYFVTDNLLFVASTPAYAQTLAATRPSSLSAKLQQQLPANAQEYLYCDMAGLARPLCALIRAQNPQLPATETILRHLSPYLSATLTQPRSETTTTLSPLGKPLTVMAGVAGIVAAVRPALPALGITVNPIPPTRSSDTPAPRRPAENQKAPFAE